MEFSERTDVLCPHCPTHRPPAMWATGNTAGALGSQGSFYLTLINSGWNSHLWLVATVLERAAVATPWGHTGKETSPGGAARRPHPVAVTARGPAGSGLLQDPDSPAGGHLSSPIVTPLRAPQPPWHAAPGALTLPSCRGASIGGLRPRDARKWDPPWGNRNSESVTRDLFGGRGGPASQTNKIASCQQA